MRFLVLLPVALCACPADDKTSGTTADTGTGDTDSDTDTDTLTAAPFDVNGIVLDLLQPNPLEPVAGLCVALFDPSPALMDKPPALLQGPIEAKDGTFSFPDVKPPSALGLLLSVNDCNEAKTDCGKGDNYFTTATGIQGASFPTEKPYVIDTAAFATSCGDAGVAGLQASAVAAGYKGTLTTDGFLAGYVWDLTNTPIGGATVTCDDCGATLYGDVNPVDGLFTSKASINLATNPASGFFLIPAGPVGEYTADDAGTHTFESQLNGSQPGAATATVFFGE